MRRLFLPLLAVCLGCRTVSEAPFPDLDAQVMALASVAAPPSASIPPTAAPGDLPGLWHLALQHNPALREAAADIEAARGQLLQASKYPNPHLAYAQEEIGTKQDAAGALQVQVTQEIVTAGKRRLDMAIAGRSTDAASVALNGRKFEVLTRIRRGYYDYVTWSYTLKANEQVVATLEKAVDLTRRQVKEVGNRPRSDLVRQEATLEEARIGVARSRISLESAWQQLAADIGLPDLPQPTLAPPRLEAPRWDAGAVRQQVLTGHTDIKEAVVAAERARLEVERARAEAVPNVTLGGGYAWNFAENEQGAVVSLEAPLPLWDCKQGRLHEAQARWAKAQAAVQTVTTRLAHDSAEAFGRYEAARRQVEDLELRVLPRVVESADLISSGYRSSAANVTFADVLLAQAAVNETRLRIAEARRDLWHAIADLEGLLQLDIVD